MVLKVIDQNSSAPKTHVRLIFAEGDGISPGLVKGRILLIENGPVSRVSIQPTDAGCGCRPNVFALDRHAVNQVICEAACQVCIVLKLAGGVAAQSTKGSGPDVASLLIYCNRHHGTAGEPVCGRKHSFYLPVFN